MNRREAIAALVAMPGVAKISTLPEAENGVLVVECDQRLSDHVLQRMVDELMAIWPNRKIVVLDQSIRLKIAPE